MATTPELLQRQIDAIGNLKNLSSSDTPEFKQWHQLTKAIIERRLSKVKAEKFPSGYDFWPNRIGPWDEDELKESLLKGLGMAEAYLNGLIQEIELLGEDNAQVEERPSSKTHPKMKFGEPGRNGQPGGGGSVFIQAEHFNISGGGKISADGGDHIINNNSTKGNNSPMHINYGTINESTAEAIENITKLMLLISDSQLDDKRKQQLIGNAEIVKASLIQPEPDRTILRRAWDGVQIASTIAGAVQLLQMIGHVVLPLLK